MNGIYIIIDIKILLIKNCCLNLLFNWQKTSQEKTKSVIISCLFFANINNV
jgi:hypothetical protein